MSFISVGDASDAQSSSTARASPVALHTRLPENDEPSHKGKNRMYYCKYCPSYGAQNTTNFRQHLLRKHGLDVGLSSRQVDSSSHLAIQALNNQASVVGQYSPSDLEVLKRCLNKQVVTEAIISLVVLHSLPFRIIESCEFHTLCKSLNAAASTEVIASHSTLRNHIEKSWLVKKDIVRKKLQSALSTVHLSLDVWTSPNSKLLLGVCAHFVDYETEGLSKALLGLPSIPSHHADSQLDVLLPLLHDYGIFPKLGTVIGDNATTNDKLCRLLSSALEAEKLAWNPTENRIRCNGHIINLVVQAFLFQGLEDDTDSVKEEDPCSEQARFHFRKIGSLGKLHNIVVHTHSSPARKNQFKDLAGRGIPLDNDTRWNSWYEMLRVATEKESAIDSYSKIWYDSLQADFLSPEDWEILRQSLDFLQPFYRATKETEGDHATIDRVLVMMDVLIKHFKKSVEKYGPNHSFHSRIKNAWAVFDRYFIKTDDSPYYTAAIILQPCLRTRYLKYNWEKKWVPRAIQAVKGLWNMFKSKEVSTPTTHLAEVPCERNQNLDTFDVLIRDIYNFPRPASKDELEEYMAEIPLAQISGSALAWWMEPGQRARWPTLSRWAINVLSIPAMSAAPERVFSGGRRTISWERMQLGEDTIEMLECLKDWERSGLTAEVGMLGGGFDDD